MRNLLAIFLTLILTVFYPSLPSSNTIRPGRPPAADKQPEQKPSQGQSSEKPGQPGQGNNGQEERGEPLKLPQQQPDHAAGSNNSQQPEQSAGDSGGQQKQASGGDNAQPEQAAGSGAPAGGDTQGQTGQNASAELGSGQDSQPAQTGAAPAEGSQQAATPASDNQPAVASGAAEAENTLTINAIGNTRPDISGKPLVLPENSENMDFLNGEWSFERQLKGADGEILNWNFSSQNGKGVAVLKDRQNNSYEASMVARLEDGVLRMHTDNFTSRTSPKKYNSEYIECRNGPNGAVCTGSDGFGEWSGERIFPAGPVVAKQTQTQVNRDTGSRSEQMEANEANMTELAADGPEIPEEVLNQTLQATMVNSAQGGVGSLAGHWRYSQELARKADGQPVTMEFHFDENGKGYSLIRGGEEGDFKANATAVRMPNGSLRVKTDSYSNGHGKGFYPTFMECAAKNGQPLSCNLSNGWMHSDNGRLVDLNSYQKNMERTEMEELLPGVPSGEATSASSETASSGQDEQSMEDMLAGAAEKAQEEAKKNYEASLNGKDSGSSRSGQLQLPSKGDSVSFMEGNWLCHTGLANVRTNEPVVMEFSFNKNGKGTSTILERKSGQLYRASAKASFRNGILRVNTSMFKGKRGAYNPNTIICRDRGGVAHCTGKNSNIVWDANFTRKR